MNDDLAQKIRAVLRQHKRPKVKNVTSDDPETHAAIDAIKSETGMTRQEILWRAVRLYLYSYLHTHTKADRDLGDVSN